jgi:hypothetical protein
MEELNYLFQLSGMSERDFAYALSQLSQQNGGTKLSLKALENMLDGIWNVPAGVIEDARIIIEHKAAVKMVIHKNPELNDVSYKHFKYELDS